MDRLLSSVCLGLLLASSSGCALPGGSGGAGPRPAASRPGYTVLHEGERTAYQSPEIVFHKPRPGEQWALAGTLYQNDLTAAGGVDPTRDVAVLMAYRGDEPRFAPAKDSLLFIMALDGERVDCRVVWQEGPTRTFGSTTSLLAVALKPDHFARPWPPRRPWAG